jgi:hypothetical protein
MKLISATQMAWSEPYFFLIRLREPWGWRRRGLIGMAVATVMFLAIQFTGQGRLGALEAIGVSLACGAVILLLLDAGNIQREVTIKEDCIIYNSVGVTHWMGSFKLPDIHQIHLMRPEDWNRPWGAMLIRTADDGFLLGIPNKIELETVANVLHRLGVQVQLEGWTPSETDTRMQVMQEIEFSQEAAAQSGPARIWPVGADEGRLSPPLHTAVAFVLALGPLVAALFGLIGAGVYIAMNWSALGGLEIGLILGGALAVLVIAFIYLALIGQFLAARYQIGVARTVLRSRTQVCVQGADDDLIPVEVFDRCAWTSSIIKSSDFGFLQIDSGRQALKFEGNKNRWEIPAGALVACRIEEAIVGSEGNPGAEKRYYVVLALDHVGAPWEAGLVRSRTELGNDNSQSRYERAEALFGRISKLVGPAKTQTATASA